MPQPMSDVEMKNCADECSKCHQICLATLRHCLEKGGAHASASHVRLMMDCAQICATSADFMTRMSPLHELTCHACAEICQICSEDCVNLDDEHMTRCAEACRSCAEMCRQMSGAGMGQ